MFLFLQGSTIPLEFRFSAMIISEAAVQRAIGAVSDKGTSSYSISSAPSSSITGTHLPPCLPDEMLETLRVDQAIGDG
jgi:hypothetical protein